MVRLPLIIAFSMPRRPIQTVVLVWFLILGCWSLRPVSADEGWKKTPDGRLVVDLKGIEVGLPILAANDLRSAMNSSVQLYFPGSHLDILSVKDLMSKPEESRRHIEESKAIVLVVWGAVPGDWFNDIIDGVTRVRAVDLAFGPDANCNSWKRTYRNWRNEALARSADSKGWIGQGEGFVRFLDDNNRSESRYYAVNCDVFGACRMTVCRDGLTTSFKFNGTGKRDGFRQPIDTSRFGGAIDFAIEKLNRLLLERKADLTYGADE